MQEYILKLTCLLEAGSKLLYREFLNDMRIFKDAILHEKLMIVCFINYAVIVKGKNK